MREIVDRDLILSITFQNRDRWLERRGCKIRWPKIKFVSGGGQET